MTTPEQSQPPHWTVTSVRAGEIGTDAAGNSTTGYLVKFQFDDGTPGQTFIPDSVFGTPQVRPAIEGAAAALATVRYMSGGMTS